AGRRAGGLARRGRRRDRVAPIYVSCPPRALARGQRAGRIDPALAYPGGPPRERAPSDVHLFDLGGIVPVQRLSEEQIRRYHRHIIMDKVGPVGQRKLLTARVPLLGAAGLGSPAALYLAAAGVGTLGIVDFDTVDVSNLQRQILHRIDSIGKLKVDSAAETLNGINPDVTVIKFPFPLRSDNVFDVIRDFDVIVDGTDNFPTRYLINDAAVMTNKTVVHGSISQFD